MKKLLAAGLLFACPIFGQADNPPRWFVTGIGTLANRPATCVAPNAALVRVYVCLGAGCTTGVPIHLCTSANTWTPQVPASTALTDTTGLVRGGASLTTDNRVAKISSTDGTLAESSITDDGTTVSTTEKLSAIPGGTVSALIAYPFDYTNAAFVVAAVTPLPADWRTR